MTMALTLIGGVVSAVGTMAEANARADAADYNAKVAEQNKKASREQAKSAAQQRDRDNRRVLGTMRANYGATGLVAYGSVLDVFEDSYAEAELDVKTILYKGEVQAADYQNQANLSRMEARASRSAGMIGAFGTMVNTGSKLASQAGSAIFNGA